MNHIYTTYKTVLLFMAALFISRAAHAQTATQNYVRTRVPRVAITRNTRLDSLTSTKDSVMTTIQYIDGLGRPLQTVQRQASPSGKDIVQPFAYDPYGREATKYLPYATTDALYGSYRGDALGTTTGVNAFYNPSNGTTEGQQASGVVLTQFPFATTAFEASPLNRVLEQGAPGVSWQVNGTPSNVSANHTLRSTTTVNDQSAFGSSITSNSGSRMVALYTAPINANGSRSLSRAGGNTATYPNNQLMVTISRDENWKPADGCFGTTETYTDKEGHVVLNRTYNVQGAVAQMLSTYYVYDDLGNLAFVLPPGASPDATGTAISQTTIDAKCYQYRYDERNRLTEKKVPSKGWEYTVYNLLDQAIFTQDSVQRGKSPQDWSYTKYDAMGRAVITGVEGGHTETRAALQSYVTSTLSNPSSGVAEWETPSSSGPGGYTNTAFPTGPSAVAMNVSYYDTYKNIPGFPSAYDRTTVPAYTVRTTGMPTASKVLVLNTTGDYLWTVPYYDEDGKTVRSFSQHYLAGSSNLSQYNNDDVSMGYNFARQLTSSSRLHYAANAGRTDKVLVLTSVDSYNYDQMGRKRYSYNQLTDGTGAAQQKVVVSLSAYNEIGQPYRKGLHSINNGANSMQNVDYRYNARGWLTSINNSSLSNAPLTSTDTNHQFGMDLKYDDAATPQYNGNIGSVRTLTGALSGTSYPALTYNYAYDKLNRLVNAISTTTTANDNFYNENLAYDLMGNIQKLNRYDKVGSARTAIDSLTYSYTTAGGNRVDRIDDAVSGGTYGFLNGANQTGEYTYDGNGNQLVDLNKGLTQQYNMLNLPQTAVKGAVSVAYVYDASGRKLRKLVTAGTTTTITEYINGIEYDYVGSTPVLSFIQTEEGRARKSGSVYKYEYDLKDHLGNTRLTTTWNSSDATQLTPLNLQRSDYYAFGYTIQSLIGSTPSPANHYLYNHKELQDETGLYDYGARFYDPVIGRWSGVDRFAEKYYDLTMYNYGANNPIKNIDINGDTIVDKDHIVDNLRNNANQQIAAVNSLIKAGKIDAKFASGYLDVLNGTLNDISTLENSTTTYNVYNDNSGNTAYGQGETRYNSKTKDVDIAFGQGVQPNDIWLQAHELVHGVQYNNGDISLMANGSGAGALVDITDEVQANNRQLGLGAGVMNYGNTTFYTPTTLAQKQFPDGTRPYQGLKRGPININSVEGTILRMNTTIAGQNGYKPQEVYKGWEKDYNIGKSLKK